MRFFSDEVTDLALDVIGFVDLVRRLTVEQDGMLIDVPLLIDLSDVQVNEPSHPLPYMINMNSG